MAQRLTVTKESETGRNQEFVDTYKHKTLSRSELVREIKQGNYPNYHTRVINGIETPVSNPDNSKNNNLG